MYLDPGFGGMLLQVIVAIVAVGGAIIFSLRRKIRQLFSRSEVDVSPTELDDITVDDEDNDAVDMLDN